MTFNKICIMLPTYGRSDTFLPRCLNSITQNISDRSKVCFMVMTNERDPESEKVAKSILQFYDHFLVKEASNHPSLSMFYNDMYKNTVFNQDNIVVSMIGDDMEFKTFGWETRLLKLINHYKGVGVFYCAGDDRFKEALCVNAFFTRPYIREAGGDFMCSFFHANGIDMVWQITADAMGHDRYVEDVIILHHQCSRPHIGADETYTRLKPMRNHAIKNKDKEFEYAKKKIQCLKRAGYDQMYNPVRHLRDGWEKRKVYRTDEL